jgi:hypothetical protein
MTATRQNAGMRTRIAALLLVPFLVAACGRKSTAVLPDSWEVSLAKAGEAWIAKDWARTWTLCENAFTIASKTKALAPSLNALDCLGETAVKQDQPGKALPFYAKFLADHRGAMATHTARFRIRNNHAVLLHGSGKADEAVAELREVVAAAESGPINYPVYLALVRNLALAWYGSASSPEAKAWVRETGTWLQERLEPDAATRIGGHRGATRALEALIAIGERQALEERPQRPAAPPSMRSRRRPRGAASPRKPAGGRRSSTSRNRCGAACARPSSWARSGWWPACASSPPDRAV